MCFSHRARRVLMDPKETMVALDQLDLLAPRDQTVTRDTLDHL